MKHTFSPKNFYEAFNFYMSIPFYTLKDLIAKKAVEFSEAEMISVEKKTIAGTEVYKVNYERTDFNGWFFFKGQLEQSEYEKINLNKTFVVAESMIMGGAKKMFSPYSPVLWALILLQLLGYLCFSHQDLLFPGHLKPELYVNNFCGISCVKNASNTLNSFILINGIILIELSIGVLFFFYISRKIKNAEMYSFVRLTSFLLLIIGLTLGHDLYEKSMKQNQMNKMVVVYRLLNTPDYFQNTNNRKIASEIMGKEIKERKHN